MLPLEGITVVSLEQAVATPFATCQLADLGARVIKVERPGVGDFARSYDETVKGLSSHFVWLNRSKESLALDLKREGAKKALDLLITKADVFVQNLAPGAAERLGLGTDALREKHPRLIFCNVSGYGSSGPYRDKKAYNLLVQCETGLVSITGTPETPSKLGISAADLACGIYAYSGILSARLVEQTGFETVYIMGFGTSASLLGRPDVGILALCEMEDNARHLVQAVEVPVIVDADNGYGDPINVIRTVKEYEAAGVSVIYIEDQLMPKKCGHIEGKQVIEASELVKKVRAAIEARHIEDFLFIVRTDARAGEGMDGTPEWARFYRDAGDDALFVEAPQSEKEVAAVAEAFPDVPLLFNWLEGGETPPVPLERLRELGFSLIIFPLSTMLAATRSVRETLEKIHADGSPISVLEDRLLPFEEFTDFIGLPEIQNLEERFEDEEVRAPR